MIAAHAGHRRHRIRARVAAWIAGCLVVATACLTACPGPASRPETRDAVVAIECPVTTAEVWVNERFIALVGNLRGGIRVSPGQHRIELRHDGYHTHYAELTLTAGQRYTLAVDLAEILP